MPFWRLGKKKQGGDKRLGHKDTGLTDVVQRGAKTAYDNVERVGGMASKVENIAGKVSGAAGTGATLAAVSGLGVPVATALGAVSAGAGAVGRLAGFVADKSVKAGEIKEKVERGRSAFDTAMKFMG